MIIIAVQVQCGGIIAAELHGRETCLSYGKFYIYALIGIKYAFLFKQTSFI